MTTLRDIARRRLVRGVSAVFVAVSILGASARAYASPSVLMLNSYHPQYEWTDRLVDGVRDELEGAVAAESMHVEYMDSRRMLDQPDYLDQLAELYRMKYAHQQPDLVIASDDNALAFLRQRAAELFPGVPIVFCGINAIDPSEVEPLENATGVLEGLDVQSNLALIRRIHPEAERVVVLSDRTSLGRNMTRQAQPALARFEAEGLHSEVWDDFALEELLERLGELGEEDVVLLLAIHKDREGRYFSFDEHLPLLTARSSRPVYALFGMLLGKGIVGGAQNDPYLHGRHAAALAKRVLDGESPSSIPVMVEDYVPRFDHRQLRRFDIDMERLPEHSTILFRPRSILRDYPRELAAGAFAAAVLTLLSATLIVSLHRQRQAERALRLSEARLHEARKFETLGRLSGGIAHDFKNLLTPIVGFAELVKLETDDPKLVRYVDGIEHAADSASELIGQLLAYSRREPTQGQVVDLDSFVRSHLPMLRQSIGVEVDLDIHSSTPPARVMGQPAQIEQVLLNLVANASDAMERRGRISISVPLREVDEASARELGIAAGRYAVLRVDDSGPGIDPALLRRVFEPLFTTKGPGAGTGLGLSSVYGIARRHGGTAVAANRKPTGARFEIYLPATDLTPQDPARPRSHNPGLASASPA